MAGTVDLLDMGDPPAQAPAAPAVQYTAGGTKNVQALMSADAGDE